MTKGKAPVGEANSKARRFSFCMQQWIDIMNAQYVCSVFVMLIKQITMKNSEKGSSDPGNNLDNVERNKKSQFLRDAKISSVTVDVNASSALEQTPTVDSSASQDTLSSSPSRKIRKDDIVQIFRLRSVTTSSVSREQVLRIRKVHDMISDGVKFNFNYVTFLHIASIVAALGLATDSSTTVISSMLLSPIMGPVIGMAYGVIIWDWPLIKRSVKIELISIILCLILGLIIGFSTYWTHMAYAWPTEEMYSRSSRHGFLAGIPIAFFSGMGVALSVLDDHVSSLVGVAISASLLPPAGKYRRKFGRKHYCTLDFPLTSFDL